MINNFLLIMSLSGSVILLLYLLVSPIAKRYFSFAWTKIFTIMLTYSILPVSGNHSFGTGHKAAD